MAQTDIVIRKIKTKRREPAKSSGVHGSLAYTECQWLILDHASSLWNEAISF